MSESLPRYQSIKPLRDYSEAGRKRNTPTLPYEYWMKPNGNLVRVAMKSTRNLRQAVGHEMYTSLVERTNVRNGWVPWLYSYASRIAPHVVAGRSHEEWSTWIHEEQARRFAAAKEASRQYESAWGSQDEREALKTQAAMTAALKEVVTMVQNSGSDDADTSTKRQKKATKE